MTRTLTENLDVRMKGIAMEDLSANLCDAVIITRRLGFRYLWIDSLCMASLMNAYEIFADFFRYHTRQYD